jgi:mRNA (guanine-N7-)-methyltransferase
LDKLNIKFDLVSCQFSLHYSFETEEKARNFIRNASHALKPGGFFIGTIPDANWIVKRLRHSGGLTFGNELYTISFESKSFPKFGARYNFFLKDAVENVPEYLVHFPTLVSLCNEYGMELVYEKRFHEFYVEHKTKKNIKLMEKMSVFDQSGSMPQNNWEIAEIYMTFAFRKQGTVSADDSKESFPKTHPRLLDPEKDIIKF